MKSYTKLSLMLGAGIVGAGGIILTPFSAIAATQSTNINATVGSTLSMTTTSGGNVNFSLTPGASAVVSSASDTISVSTNSSNGYSLTLSDSDATTTLVSGANTIAAHAGTTASPTALAANTWGFAVPGGSFDASYSAEASSATSTSKWAGMPALASPYTLKSTATTASSDQTTVWYAAKVDATKPTGTYTDTVVYTATPK